MSDPIEQSEVQMGVVSDKEIAYAVRQDEPPQTYIHEDVVRVQIEEAVKRALEGAAEHLSMFAEPGVMLEYSLDDEIKAIRALDPAQFVEG